MATDTRDDWKVWLRIGLLSFGGPAGQIALMHRELVAGRGWIDERGFASGLSFCMLLPGPEAQQLATYIGWTRGGWRQAVVAGSLFFLPGAVLMFLLCLLYVAARDLSVVQALFLGIQCAIVSVVVEALFRVGRRALRGPASVVIAVLAFGLVSSRALPFPAVLALAAAAGLLFDRGRGGAPPTAAATRVVARPSRRPALVALVLWLLPVAVIGWLLGDDHRLTRIALLFSELAVLSFGGAYAVLAYVTEQAVQVEGWLSTTQMMAGLGLAETTPGPLILVLQFVAFLAGFQQGGDGALWHAAAASLLALWVLFLPSFVWIFAGAAQVERLSANPRARAALQGITAAVLGVIAHVALWFVMHLVFAEVDEQVWGPLRVALPDWASLRPEVLLPTAVAAIVLFAFHRGIAAVLLSAVAVAALQQLLG